MSLRSIMLYHFSCYKCLIHGFYNISFKEAFLMPFTTISRKMLCEDLLPLFPLPSSSSSASASVSMAIPMSISYYEVHFHQCMGNFLLLFSIELSNQTRYKMHHFHQCMRDFSIPSKSQFVKRNWSHIFCAIYLIGCLDFNFFFPSLGCFSSCFISSDMSAQFCWLCMLPSTWWAIFRYCKLYRRNKRIYAWLEQFKEWLYVIGSCTVVCSCWLRVCGSLII